MKTRFARLLALALILSSASVLEAQSVLVHSAMDTADLNKYSGYASLNVTVVNDAGWMALTAPQFAAFDMIWIGGNCCSAALYNVIFSTRALWQPAITGRVVVTSLDPAKHSDAGATVFSNAVATWLLGSSGTSLYVSPDWGFRSFDFMAPALGAWSNVQSYTDVVNVTVPTHPTMTGSTSGSLGGWGNSSHVDITAFPASGWLVVATLASGRPAVLVREGPSCNITAPVAMATVGGTVNVLFDVDHPASLPLDVTIEFSDDGGVTWAPATAAASSPTPNPMLGVTTPSTGVPFDWNSVADAVGMASITIVSLRLTVTDGMDSGVCRVDFNVDNVPPPPTCTIMAPAGLLRYQIDLSVDAASISAPSVTVDLEFSIDGGTTFAPMTMAATSPNPNPASGVTPGAQIFRWDSRADGVGLSAVEVGVVMRAQIDDGVSVVPGTCSTIGDIDNTMICFGICGDCNLNAVGPDVIDALTAAQVSAGLIIPTPVQIACCDVNTSGVVDVIDALFIAQSAAGLGVVLMCV